MNDASSGRLDTALLEALAQTSHLVLEVSPEDEENSNFRQHMWDQGLLPAGQDLLQVLEPATAQELQEFLKEHKIPLRERRALLRMKPWLASLTLLYSFLREAGAVREFGSEQQLISLARARDLPILGLEEATSQLALMAEASQAEQEYHLRQSIQEVRAFLGTGEESAEVHALFDAYRQGNLEALEVYTQKLASDAESRSFYERFLVQRNNQMVEKILTLRRDKTLLFVAVGALHLPGTEGLLQAFEKKGFALERVAAKGRVHELYLPVE
jgi:uncharacterized protein YbaP (TraB family)